jgi:hypothetical protein
MSDQGQSRDRSASRGREPPEGPGISFPLPEPLPELLPPPDGEDPASERTYFDPPRWDAEFTTGWKGPDERDPVAEGKGRLEGGGTAALFVSDFHLADGTAGGDDFLESHLRPEEALGGLYTGFFPAGDSRARLFTSVLTFALRRVEDRAQPGARLDVVGHGDLINFLELKGRGGTLVSSKHRPLFRALAAVRSRAQVYWLRGNHDYVVPTGLWERGEFYTNDRLQTLAEHGDFWDGENWPPGPLNKGSQTMLTGGGPFEVHSWVNEDGTLHYLMAGLDNLRPWSDDAIQGFLNRRAKYSDVALAAALLAMVKDLGAADDSAAYKGARKRRKGAHRDWLMVQGHTHVPAAVSGVYYNTGTWISTLVAPGGKEAEVSAFPFLLVYLDRDGRRVEEYYTVGEGVGRAQAEATLRSPEDVNELRKSFGYEPIS